MIGNVDRFKQAVEDRVRSEPRCFEILRRVRWPDGVVCPRWGATRVTTHTNFDAQSRRRYLCLACRRTFTDLTGTIFAQSNLPLETWFRCLDLLWRCPTTGALAQTLGVKWETAARMQRRLVAAWTRPGLIRNLQRALDGR